MYFGFVCHVKFIIHLFYNVCNKFLCQYANVMPYDEYKRLFAKMSEKGFPQDIVERTSYSSEVRLRRSEISKNSFKLFCEGDSIWRQLKMADKLKAVKITFKELEHIVEKKGGNKTFNQQRERINGIE